MILASAAVAAVLVTAAVSTEFTVAQQAAPGGAPAIPRRPLKLQPPPADFRALPATAPLMERAGQNADCAPAWPCRLRLFGIIEKNGGVGLKGPALTW